MHALQFANREIGRTFLISGYTYSDFKRWLILSMIKSYVQEKAEPQSSWIVVSNTDVLRVNSALIFKILSHLRNQGFYVN